MNIKIKKLLLSKTAKRTVSGLTALALLFGTLPISEIREGVDEFSNFIISASAAPSEPAFPYTSTDINGNHYITVYTNQLVRYSQDYADFPDYHKDDHILITTSGNIDMQQFIYGYQGIGTDDVAFAGSIEIGSNQQEIVLNLDAPLFNNVLDSVTLTNNGKDFNIARAFDPNQTQISGTNNKLPLLAKKVEHDYNGTPAEWNISVVSPSKGTDKTLRDFGGFIGSLDSNAKLTVNVTMNTAATDSRDITVVGAAESDIGLVCGSMSDNAELNFSLNGSRKISSVTTEYGHVGGLVGSMGSGSVLSYSGTNILNNNADIKTTYENGYAGGIVGYNEGGAVIISLPNGTSSYLITQIIEGKEGAGGVYGYFKPGEPVETDNGDGTTTIVENSINIDNYDINCQVNGTGYDGGLFGVLDTDYDYSITGTSLTSSHASGSADGYGGLIGRYANSDLTKKLNIGVLTATSSKGTAAYYGGGIAVIGDSIDESGELSDGSCYVKFDSFTANAAGANSMTFGGLVSIADNAFIDANDITVNVTNNSYRFKGGGVVGRLESGVLRMSGTTDLSNTYAEEFGFKGGQIVGYRDNALIFGTDDWQLKRGTVSYTNNNNAIYIKADDIGSWGEVLRFDGKDTSTEGQTSYGYGTDKTVVTVNETDHYATVAAPSYDSNGNISVGSVSDFAKASLNMQMNDGQSDGVLRFDDTSNTSSSLLGMNITLPGDVSLKGTGLTGFTRDNVQTDSLSADKCVYTGMLDGDGHSITLAIGEPYGYRGDTELTDHSSEGNGKIYHHKYNGLFGIVDTSAEYVAKNLTIKGTADVSAYYQDKDHVFNAYVGGIAGRAKGNFKVDNITMTDTVTNDVHETVFSSYGSGRNYVGGLLGQASDEIDDISITNCNIKCNIQTSNTNEDSCFGGIIGCISYTGNNSKSWSFEDVTVSGEINNTNARATNKLGGLVAAIAETTGQSNRALDLTSVKADGLTVKSVGSGDSTMGGILGYTWLNVNTTFHNVEAANSTINMTTGNGALGGLVYQGTGHWIVEPYSVTVTDENTSESTTTYHNGIKINGLTVTNSNAKSFGGILHSTMTKNTALYLEILADAEITEDETTSIVKSYNIASANFTGLKNGCVFDEIAAYTASTDTGANSHAVVSIHSDDFSTEGGTTASGTYLAQTARGAVPNPNTRYYYNLDTIRTATGASDLLMRWALHNYAHSSIQGYFKYGTGFSDTNIPVGTYNMQNYSWYPVDISGTVTVNGTFTFYNKEFEESEQVKANSETNSYKRTSLYDSNNSSYTQHKYLHASLFRNVTGTLNVGTVTMAGNVGIVENKSGALVCGQVIGSNANSIAKLNITGGVTLSGIYVNGFDTTGNTDKYAPLLINSIKQYTNSLIKGVETSGYSDNFKAGSSLIGDVGTTEASKITLTFKDMKLDGRKTVNSGAYSLNDVYGTKSSIFTRATFLNSFKYNSGSSGVYEFNLDDDWTRSGTEGSYTYSRTSSQGVTYGSEISDSSAHNQYYGKEFWYKNTQGGTYTNYSAPTVSGTGKDTNGDPITPAPVSFSGFLPYVYDASTKANVSSEKKYQIKVNHADTQMTGCGTYNDPYIITSGDDLNNIAKILNGDCSNQKIALPNVYASSTDVSFNLLKAKKWDDYGHTDFSYDATNGNFKNSNNKTYNVEQVQTYLAGAYYKIEEGTDIELPSGYLGLGNTETTAAFFRGIIVGNGETITLKGSNPLIHTSYGSVIRNVQVVVDAEVTVTGTKADFKEKDGCGAYGAVIGQALGGDNIIDDVSVGFSNNATITVGGSNANLAAVGGYVGVITYGSLIFRNMSREESHAADIQGIPSDSTIVRSSSETDLISDTNKKWLYVNPIVGRVINAAVFTESDKYRPFEEGTREYVGDGETTTKYTWPDGAVTMQNGTKNYSIADLEKPTAADMSDRIYVSNYSEATWSAFLTYKTTVDIPDAQSLFVLSLLTQGKMTSTYYAHNSNKKSRYTNQAGEGGYAGYYNDNGNDKETYDGINLLAYKTTHMADYDHVGSSDPDAEADCAVATQDTYTPATRQNPDSLVPYLVKNYTKPLDNASDGSYGVFSISNGGTVITNMTWGGTSGTTWYMPDGFKGLGCIFKLNNSLINDVTLSINKLEGNNHVIDLNMSLYHYDSDSEQYLPVSGNASGFGLFDALRSNRFGRGQKNGNYDPNNKIKDFDITGSVTYHAYTTSGAIVNGSNKIVSGNANYSSVGAFVGRFDPAQGDNHRNCLLQLENVDLKQMKVDGVYRTGGLIGYAYNDRNETTRQGYNHIYINDCTADNLSVSSVLYAGGLVGYSFKYAYDITNVTIEEPNIVLTLPFASKNDGNNAVGGLIGYIETETRNQQVCIKNVTVGKESPTGNYSAYIGYTEPTTYPTNVNNEVIRAGGLIGRVNTPYASADAGDYYRTKIERCNVYNVDIKGHYTGGVIGQADNDNKENNNNNTITIGVLDTIVKNTSDNMIMGHRVDNASRGTGGITGYVEARNFVINNCLVDGYIIKSTQRTGGVVGYTQATKTEIDNTEIKGVSFISNAGVGGLVGYLNNPLNGYNIRTDDIRFVRYSGTGSYGTGNNPTSNTRGHIVGYNYNKAIMLAGFSRNNLNTNIDCGSERMVGNYADTNTPYRTGGYVIFADYYNFTNKNIAITSTKASTVNDTNNVAQPTYKIDTQADNTPNNFPYVTVSPSQALENGADGRFLTGDAVISLTYPNSMFAKILEDKSANKTGAYTNFKSTNYGNPSTSIAWSDSLADAVRTQFYTSAQQVPGSGAKNIPLLVIEDTDHKAVTQMLNSYINVLANTSGYNYAADYNATKDTSTVNRKYRISLNKCTYDKDTGLYTIGENGTACLKKQNLGGTWYFRMTATNVDNEVDGVLQFSLLDVQFLDPSDTSDNPKTAYHLYIPVYVKKLLQYDFKAAMTSNTDYYADAYGSLNGNSVFENLGNPVTMKFEYVYTRTADEWKDAINGGENVLTNIYKSLNVSGGAWPSGTKMVLVDANNKDKAYYLEPTTSNGTLSLCDFTTKSGEHFKPAPLLNLMNVTIGQPTSGDKNLTPVTVDTEKSESEQFEDALEKGAIVYYNGTYYRTVTDDDTDLEDSDKWAVTAVDTTIQPERYYLSIFTPKSNDTTIYHYQFTGPDSLPQRSSSDIYDGYRPNHITNTNAVVHLFIGDLYETTFKMTVDSQAHEREMSRSNKKLKVTMDSTIKLKSVSSEIVGVDPSDPAYDKTRKGIAQNMRANSGTSEIYQAFLSTYDRVDTIGGSSNISVNMQAPPFVIINKYKCYAGTNKTGTEQPISYTVPTVENKGITENYVQLFNNKNIVSNLGNESNSYAVTYELEYELNYFDENDLPAQFSLNPEKVNGVGTKVIGFSNVSSSKSNIAHSVTSAKDDTTSLRYFVTDSAQATLNYNVVKTSGEMLGPYSDLGINPLDTGETEHTIRTTAVYDAHSLKNSGDYIEFSVKLSKKTDYNEYLSLPTYIKELKILGTSNDEIFNSSWADGSTHLNGHVKVTKTDNEYKIRVHKDYVQEQGNANSGRYLFPITFIVYTGDSKFNNNTDDEDNLTGLMYSNYRVTVHAEMWSALTGGTESDPSNADSYLIYTNARIEPNVIK